MTQICAKKFNPAPDVFYNDGSKDNAGQANRIELSIKWNWREGKHIVEFTPLPIGPNSCGR